MQDLKALEGKSLAELREIAKALGIKNVMIKKRELIEKIAGTDTPEEAPAENEAGAKGEVSETAAEPAQEAAPQTAAPKAKAPRGRRPRLAKRLITVHLHTSGPTLSNIFPHPYATTPTPFYY